MVESESEEERNHRAVLFLAKIRGKFFREILFRYHDGSYHTATVPVPRERYEQAQAIVKHLNERLDSRRAFAARRRPFG